MDSRFTLKGTFSIYGKTYPMDMSLNWSAWADAIDPRITDFFRASYEEAHDAFNLEMENDREARERSDIEAKERAELKRLTEKYAQK